MSFFTNLMVLQAPLLRKLHFSTLARVRKTTVLSMLILIQQLCFGFTADSTTAKPQRQLNPKLFARPIVGSVTSTSAKVWIAYRGNGQNALILGDTAEHKVYYPTDVKYIANSKGDVALTMEFTGLKPDHLYNILVSIEGWGTSTQASFRTQADTTIKDFNFVLGSCALMFPGVSRLVFPAATPFIFKRMQKKKADFMVWLGDDVYYMKNSYKNLDGMFKLNMRLRKSFPFYRDFLSSTPQYAIWDDHDYGPNDSGREYALKDSSLKVFKGMWPNTYPKGEEFKGNFFNFRYYDAEFFMTDDRYFRQIVGHDSTSPFLGETQLVWLKNKLLLSDATFKFIGVGSQVLNDNHFGESYTEYIQERNELLDFISNNNIKGVIFLTGDKHFSELSKRDWKGYPMHDFTCSPLTTPPLPRRLLGAYTNHNRVPHSDYAKRNFGRISFSGDKGNRSMKIEIIGRSGKTRRTIVLNEKEMRKK